MLRCDLHTRNITFACNCGDSTKWSLYTCVCGYWRLQWWAVKESAKVVVSRASRFFRVRIANARKNCGGGIFPPFLPRNSYAHAQCVHGKVQLAREATRVPRGDSGGSLVGLSYELEYGL